MGLFGTRNYQIGRSTNKMGCAALCCSWICASLKIESYKSTVKPKANTVLQGIACALDNSPQPLEISFLLLIVLLWPQIHICKYTDTIKYSEINNEFKEETSFKQWLWGNVSITITVESGIQGILLVKETGLDSDLRVAVGGITQQYLIGFSIPLLRWCLN